MPRRAGQNTPTAAVAGVLTAVALALAIGGPTGAHRVGVSVADPGRCAASSGQVAYPPRADRDRTVLPVGYRALAPVTAVWCRYGPDGALTAAFDLDAARSARLAAVLATPVGGWPLDALAAKTIPPMTAAQVAAASAPRCAAPAAAEWVRFTYGQGPDAAVLVRPAPCRDAANGVLRLRASAELLAEFAALAPR